MAGTISEVNPGLNTKPELVNTDPYGAGWMIKMTVDNPSDTSNLLKSEAYSALVSA